MYNPSRDGAEEPAWVQRERENFDTHRDFNGDGKLDKDELRRWILPTHYDPFETEAGHLIYEADSDQVRDRSSDVDVLRFSLTYSQ